MAHRKVYATGGRYGTRMMTAGEPLILPGPAARLALALGKATDKRPRAARPQNSAQYCSVSAWEPSSTTMIRWFGSRCSATDSRQRRTSSRPL